VTNIHGRLTPGKDALDVLRAVFPGGTVTGVPKVRCMEIIDELEPVRRGPYTGSMVILARAATGPEYHHPDVGHRWRARLPQVGAGIVADSDPAREYQETCTRPKRC